MSLFIRVCIVMAFVLASFVPLASSADREMVEETVAPFLGALQEGDAKVLENLMSGPLKTQMNRLLKENAAYPEMLRKRFQGASLSLGQSIQRTDGSIALPLHIRFANGDETSYFLVLRKDNDRRWKIDQEIRLF